MGQEARTPNRKAFSKIPLRVYLGYLLILTLIFTAVSFAKFATAGDADDAARVASFTVGASVGSNNDLSIGFNDASTSFNTTKTASCSINVTNASGTEVAETAVGYEIVITLDSADISADKITLSIDGSTLTPAKVGSNFVYTYSGVSPMPAKVKTERAHTLSIKADSTKILDDYTNIEFAVDVNFEQID